MDKDQQIVESDQDRFDLKSDFASNVLARNALTNVTSKEEVDYKALKQEARENVAALNPKDNVQMMLAAQMISIHITQQRMMLFVNNAYDADAIAKYTNTITKLSNVFIQQVNLMKKLKGEVEKKIIIEHVNVNSGGQAVVGSVIAPSNVVNK